MAKIDDKFNLKDWEWIAVPFPASERETIAKVAWLICCKCTPEEIYKRQIDPRIVIPLCAIVLLDEIDLSKLRDFQGDANYYGITLKRLENQQEQREKVNQTKQKFVNAVTSSINPRKRWKSLFEILNIDLQFHLLYCLIKYDRLTRNDWRNIFLDIKPVINVQIEFLSTLSLTLYLTILNFLIFIVSLSPFLIFLPMIILFSPIFVMTMMSIITFINISIQIIVGINLKELLLKELLVPVFWLLFTEVKKRFIILMFIIVIENMLLYTLYSQLIFSNKIILLILLIMSVFCSVLWTYTKQKQSKADNPLKEILKSDSSTNLVNRDMFNN